MVSITTAVAPLPTTETRFFPTTSLLSPGSSRGRLSWATATLGDGDPCDGNGNGNRERKEVLTCNQPICFTMLSASCKTYLPSVPPPPRTLDLPKFAESRAFELESLYSIVANRVNNDFKSQRNKRRRTTGHDDRVARRHPKKRRKSGKLQKGISSTPVDDQKQVSRRMRRKKEFTRNPVMGFCTSGDGVKRLRTHLWLAKRFKMVKQWGFCLPEGLEGRGRGSRAVLKWYRSGAVVHDGSYSCAVQLEGPEDSILSVLRLVLVPSQLSGENDKSVLDGVCYGSATLHHIGAPFSQLIAPVTYMWRPTSLGQTEADSGKVSLVTGSHRQLWIWIHIAAFSEGFGALRCASQKLMSENGASVSCIPREGQLAKLEVLGSRASQILSKILHPISESNASNLFELKRCSIMQDEKISQPGRTFVLEYPDQLPSCAVVSLNVHDPRDLPVNKDKKSITEQAPSALGGPVNTEGSMSSSWFKSEIDCVRMSDSKALWDSHSQIKPPLEEADLCQEKHQRRLSFFYLDEVTPQHLVAEHKEASASSCPILLLKSNVGSSSNLGWSIILPLSWVKAFWIPLITHGAHAIGLRERLWITNNAGVPSFPHDFPDCTSYLDFMSSKAATFAQMAELRPLAVRPSRIPIPPPWDCIKLSSTEQASSSQTLDTQADGSGMTEGDSMEMKQGDGRVCFHGFILRTAKDLGSFLNEFQGNHLLLFPHASTGGRDLSALMSSGRVTGTLGSTHVHRRRKMNFLRVLLHAWKKGAFEEGAVVCAPNLTDLSLLTSRPDPSNLEIPQSSVKTFFTQSETGKWELPIPGDPEAMEAHRRPIGFVTSGFVRGSTKPVASAVCEATNLALLRQEQWSEMQENSRPEIFVLVRNLRSSAYRLALATIVLEQQDADITFM